jgi:hypothetical protein
MSNVDKVERVARAMCQSNGLNPDADTGKGQMETVITRSTTMSKSIEYRPKPHPHWYDFRVKAAEFIAAHEALAGPNDE